VKTLFNAQKENTSQEKGFEFKSEETPSSRGSKTEPRFDFFTLYKPVFLTFLKQRGYY